MYEMGDEGMMCTLEEYIADAKSQLTCNAPNGEYITYNYTEEQIDNNIVF